MKAVRINENIRDLKILKGIKVKEISEVTGVSSPTASKWANPSSKLRPTLEYIAELAKLFDVSIEDLLHRDFTSEVKKMNMKAMGKESFELMNDGSISLYEKSLTADFSKNTDDLYDSACLFASEWDFEDAIYYGESALVYGNLEAGLLLLTFFKDYINSFSEELSEIDDPEDESYREVLSRQNAVQDEFISKLSDYGKIMADIQAYREG
jgi:transcriptional regulator with XRE-family HTH domain